MKKLTLFFVVSVFCFAIAACSTSRVKLGVDYNWIPENKCSFTSPEIKVSGIPEGTRKLRVSLTDINVPSYNHGGGTVEYNGSNIIKAGALKNYDGPCPPSGEHIYSIKVQAIDGSGKVIGVGEKTKPCCSF